MMACIERGQGEIMRTLLKQENKLCMILAEKNFSELAGLRGVLKGDTVIGNDV
jgi:hypothetical protein